MQLSRPISSVSPGLHGGVLAVLARTDKPLTGRTVAALVRPAASLSGVQKVLDDLARQGIVRAEPAGRAKLYTLNREHLAYPAIHALVHLWEELITRIAAEASTWEVPAVAVWLFGSAARGEGGPNSDVDLLVIRSESVDDTEPTWLRQVETLSEQVTAWSGNDCQVLELSSAELEDFMKRDERLVAELRRDAIPLVGARPRRLLSTTADR